MTEQTLLVTVPQAAEQFSVHKKTIWKWIQQGHLHAVRFGKRCTRVKQSDIEALIASNTAITKN